jgi:hypothetical protein
MKTKSLIAIMGVIAVWLLTIAIARDQIKSRDAEIAEQRRENTNLKKALVGYQALINRLEGITTEAVDATEQSVETVERMLDEVSAVITTERENSASKLDAAK